VDAALRAPPLRSARRAERPAPRARPGAGETAFLSPLRKPGRAALYHDAWVDDARLVVLNALAAPSMARRSPPAPPSSPPTAMARPGRRSVGRTQVRAQRVVNAAGRGWRTCSPAASAAIAPAGFASSRAATSSCRGSTRRARDILQQPDGRVVFALPYGEHNLVGIHRHSRRSPSGDGADHRPMHRRSHTSCADP
jgi:glycerol-3-phosphate dehydrogenase